MRARPRLEAIARARSGSRATAEDLLQDTWVKLENGRLGSTIENPGGFITRVAARTITDHVRKERRRSEIDAELSDILWEGADELSPERAVMGRQALAAVQAALDDLPERTRRIFLLNRIDQVPHRRIAEMFSISDEAVYYHIRRALEHLADLRNELES